MKEFEWLRRGAGDGSQTISVDAGYFNKREDRKSEEKPEIRQLNAIEKFELEQASDQEVKQIAYQLRNLLLDYFTPFLFLQESGFDEEHEQQLSSRAKEVLEEDGFGLGRMALELVKEKREKLFPLQIIYTIGEDNRRGMVMSSLGFDDQVFVSLLMAPCEIGCRREIFENTQGEHFPVFERRFRGFGGDGSLQNSLELGFRCAYDNLESLGFVDLAKEDEFQVAGL